MIMKKGKNYKKKLIIILCIVIAAVSSIVLCAYNILDKINHVPLMQESEGIDGDNAKSIEMTAEELGVSEDIPKYEETGIINVLLFGLDSREEGERTRSDVIMIATLDGKHKKIKLTSLMRDTYVYIPGRGENRINAAYAFGGPALAIRTVNENYNMDIQKYVTVDFFSLERIIDELGGVDIYIKDNEIKHLNHLIQSLNNLNKGSEPSSLIDGPGIHRLNGRQAVAYTRIRSVGHSDFERTDRQRTVLKNLVKKVSNIDIWEIPSILSNIFPEVQTNFTKNEILKYGYTALESAKNGIEELRLPYENTYEDQIIRDMAVLVADMEKNREILHKFIYEEDFDIVEEDSNIEDSNIHEENINVWE